MEKTELIEKLNRIKNGWFYSIEYTKTAGTAEGTIIRVVRRCVRKFKPKQANAAANYPDWFKPDDTNTQFGEYVGGDAAKLGRQYIVLPVTRGKQGRINHGTVKYYFQSTGVQLTDTDINRLNKDIAKMEKDKPDTVFILPISMISDIHCRTIC